MSGVVSVWDTLSVPFYSINSLLIKKNVDPRMPGKCYCVSASQWDPYGGI